MKGTLHKMRTELREQVQYFLTFGVQEVLLNDFIGKEISLVHTGAIFCENCGKKVTKTLMDGLCFPCFQSSAQGAECILRPELCRAHLGEGRDIEWEERNHNQPHVVYLAASDIVKVGVTRSSQMPFRWIDQGASSAIILAETPNRYEAGKLEVELKSFFSDKTNWQRMLKNELDDTIDLENEKWSVHEQLPADLTEFFSENDTITTINYPVLQFPEKVKSLSFDKEKVIEGKLSGIKGQYLLFEDGPVVNIRKHAGYEIEISVKN
ncbi:MAG: DUF2797 domain-containing protein [Bacteroidota bacterium]